MTAVEIERIATGGDGVGKLEDGRTVFVPRTAPGDLALIDVTELKPRYARARLSALERASSQRVEPECPHYTEDHCGGCQLQHISYSGQRELKQVIVGDALRRIGGRETENPEVVPAPAPWRYRTKITLAVSGDVIGLHQLESPASVFPLRDCLITSEPLMALWQKVRAHQALLPGDITSLVLRQDREGKLHLIAAGGSRPWNARELSAAVGEDQVQYWWKPAGGAARVVSGRQTGFPATAFEQVNPELGDVIREDAVKALGDVAGRVVWDLYGGVGDTARAVALLGGRVWSVDADRTAIEWAKRSGGGVSYLAARVEDALAKLPEPDAIVVNPPRTGLDDRVSRALNDWGATRPGGRLVYVSCDPATLGRDLKRMSAFRIADLKAFDLFPQTAHVETLALLEAA